MATLINCGETSLEQSLAKVCDQLETISPDEQVALLIVGKRIAGASDGDQTAALLEQALKAGNAT